MVAPSGTRFGDGSAAGSADDGFAPGAREARSFYEHADRIGGLLARLARIQRIRGRLRVQRLVFLVLGGLVLGLAGTVTSLAGAFLFVRGLSAGLGEVFAGRVWLAELTTGAILVGGLVLALLVVRVWSERRMLARLGELDETDDEIEGDER